MTAAQALKIAIKGTKGQLTHCYDIGDAYAFYFDEGDGSPFIVIAKNDGEKSFLHIPPISNIKLLESGKKIPIEKII